MPNRTKLLFTQLCRSDTSTRQGIVDPRGPAPPHCLPGTEAKVLLMTERVAKGYLPFRPDDPSHLDLSEEMAAALTLQPPHSKSKPGRKPSRNGNGHEHDQS